MRNVTILTTTLLISIIFLTILTTPSHASPICTDVVVQADDWLSKIAAKYLNDPAAYRLIVEATNQAAKTDGSYATIDNPDLISPGQKVCVPVPARVELSEFLEQKEDKPKILFSEFILRTLGEDNTELIWRSIGEYPDGTIRECWALYSTVQAVAGTYFSSGCQEKGSLSTPSRARPKGPQS